MNSETRIGIDLGGTKIAAICLGPDGETLFEKRVPSPQHDYDASIAAIRALVFDAEAATGERAPVGIGIPGSISPATGAVQNANSTWLNGRDFSRDIETALNRPVRISNDANCFCLSEATDGAAAGSDSVFGIILGTGCGGAFVLNGQLAAGKHNIGGEWGHNPLPRRHGVEPENVQCWCRRTDCLELYLSGSGLERDHHAATGEKLTARQIAMGNTTDCQASLARHAQRLARALAHVSNVLDPHVIVIGGGLSNMDHLYRDLPGLMKPDIFADHFQPDIRPPKFGDASGVRGAARLWP